jgi:hypothetical protein
MQVEFVVRRDDLFALNEYLLKHPASGVKGSYGSLLWVRWGIWVLVALLVFIPSFMRGDDAIPLYAFVPLLVFSVVLFTLRFTNRGLVRKNLQRIIDNNPRLMGWRRLALTPETFTAVTRYKTTTVSWAGIEKIVIMGDHAFIFEMPASAFIVPRRAFGDDEDFREFVETARDYRDHAQDGPLPERKIRRAVGSETDTGITRDEHGDD